VAAIGLLRISKSPGLDVRDERHEVVIGVHPIYAQRAAPSAFDFEPVPLIQGDGPRVGSMYAELETLDTRSGRPGDSFAEHARRDALRPIGSQNTEYQEC